MGVEDAPFDWFHLNSVTEDDDGNLILSARNTHAIYKLDKQTAELVWTLGGNDSDFQTWDGTEFAWQHDAHRSDDGTVTQLDNHVDLDDADGEDSRGLRLAFYETAMIGQVAQRRDFVGDDDARAEPVQTVDRDGFETEIPLEPGVPYVTVETLGDNGQVLATGRPQA